MAELVQAGLEGMLTELEQIQRVQLLSSDEVREVVKKRKRFEYKMQKRQKKKEDILAYIQYECALLQLIEIRRDKMNYLHKRNEIDFAIAKRINKLYKILEHRFGSGDIKIWMSHLDFLSGMKWKEECSRILRRLVQTQSHNPQVWIYGARFELEKQVDARDKENPDFEYEKMENSRRLFLEGLRIHSDCQEMYRDYFCLELHHIEMLHKREEEKEDDEETLTEVKEGKVAKIVLKKALEDIPEDPLFETELLALIFHFPIAKVRSNLFDFYIDLRGKENPAVWDALARLQLLDRVHEDGRTLADKIDQCCKMYQRAVENIPTGDMFDFYLTTLLELMPKVANADDEKTYMSIKVLEALEFGEKRNSLDEKHKQFFDKLISSDSSESD